MAIVKVNKVDTFDLRATDGSAEVRMVVVDEWNGLLQLEDLTGRTAIVIHNLSFADRFTGVMHNKETEMSVIMATPSLLDELKLRSEG